MVSQHLVDLFATIALSPDPDLGLAALTLARVEYPRLDVSRYLDQLDALAHGAAPRLSAATADPNDVPPGADPDAYARVTALSDYLFREQQFVGNTAQYEDPRNSFLNEVLERRTGIPITLALVYMEVARRVGLTVQGINFPGHFLIRCPALGPTSSDLIIDAYHGGVLLSEDACRALHERHAGDGAPWDTQLLRRATKPQILARMLLNLKRIYVRMYSYPQARDITELLLAVDRSALDELRDRGLLAYQLNDLSSALRDLQSYLRLSYRPELDESERQEHEQIWEHVKSIRRRVASLN